MKRFLLDTSALLTLRDDEAGADRVAEVLGLASSGKAKCFGCFNVVPKFRQDGRRFDGPLRRRQESPAA